MHSIAPYSIRCFNSQANGQKKEDRNHILNRIGSYDLYELLKDFVQGLASDPDYKLDVGKKQAYKADSVVFDDDKRELSFLFKVGDYGMRSDIINIETNRSDFKKGAKNADIMEYYTHFYIPKGVNEGIMFMQNIRSKGKKTLFLNKFLDFFRTKIDRNLIVSPLTYEKAFNEWKNAQSKEIKVTKFVGHSDMQNIYDGLGHVEQEMIVKPHKKGKALGALGDFFEKGTAQHNAVEMLSGFGKKVTTVVELNGKQRTFVVGRSSSSMLCEIELSSDVIIIEGVPVLDSMRNWVREICTEYAETVYYWPK